MTLHNHLGSPLAVTKIGILVGGGPAPGINSVIEAATIRSLLRGVEVVGIQDGFKWLMRGDASRIRPLTYDTVSRIHFQGGSFLGTSRANPTKDAHSLSAVVSTLDRLRIQGLITIGGDDTAFSAMRVEQAAQDRLRVVHVPKTIDNDLCLPHGMSTFGFQTARHVGVEIVKNLMVDARTTSRWYVVVTMGRKAGHLALGIGKAAGATLTVIPEEFVHDRDGRIKLSDLANIVVGAIAKRLHMGRMDGVVVLAEGLVELLDQEELERLGHVERDEHGHLRLSELDLGRMVKQEVAHALDRAGIKMTIVSKNIGYELRCADPIPFDMEYTRDLGYCAAQYLLDGGSAAMVTVDNNGRFSPLPFKEMLDPATGRTKVRMVDIQSESYIIARDYMVRLTAQDLKNEAFVASVAASLNLTPEAFRQRFAPVVH
ncbi:MAG: 6-phosphofructokinase [Nitrospirae bacterium]|nr:MAG: 6-phosphofructokinase [Nitrospirota bacterium]